MNKVNAGDIYSYVSLQARIIISFFDKYPFCKDFKFLLDFPKQGEVIVDDEVWVFLKHGKGLCFKNKAGCIVDVHSDIDNSKIFDVWRLAQYFIKVTEDGLLLLIDEMISKGFVNKVSDHKYELINMLYFIF